MAYDGAVRDDRIERIGFREVRAENGRICLNGEPVFLKGLNRHEDHGSTGCALPLALMEADIKMIKALGANAVRTSHYPNDALFLDLCDENGILVWEESHARGFSPEVTKDPLFLEQSLEVTREMLEEHYNHPSIIIWGCLNECASDDPGAVPVYEKHMEVIGRDPSRLKTYASHKGKDDLCLQLEDICSFNIYPGWYLERSAESCLEELREKMEKEGVSDKPMLISEYGAGAIYNFRDVMKVKWSEDYQSELLEKITRFFLQDERLAGFFIWQFCDVRVSGENPPNWPMTRPKSRNNKGIVDEYRRPKLAYYTLQKLFRAL